MEGFSYYNIFDTKGFEYIAIISFFIMLIPFWIMLNKSGSIKQKINKVLNILSFDILKIPQGVFHSKNHTWAHMEKSGNASVGLDDFLLHTTGKVKLRDLKKSGEIINKGDLLTVLEKDDKILQIFSPISGTVLQINLELKETPELMNNDPYGNGWIYKIKPTKWIDETKSYYLAEDSTNWTRIEIQRFKDFLAVSSKNHSTEPSLVVLQDGGELVDHPLSEQPNAVWHDFQEKFLKI
jgi:glycine cleavage system H protein